MFTLQLDLAALELAHVYVYITTRFCCSYEQLSRLTDTHLDKQFYKFQVPFLLKSGMLDSQWSTFDFIWWIYRKLEYGNYVKLAEVPGAALPVECKKKRFLKIIFEPMLPSAKHVSLWLAIANINTNIQTNIYVWAKS